LHKKFNINLSKNNFDPVFLAKTIPKWQSAPIIINLNRLFAHLTFIYILSQTRIKPLEAFFNHL